MLSTKGYAALSAKDALQPFSFERRHVGAHDLLIKIAHCGICHSDIHQAHNEWGGSIFPMVPGHEIVGVITQIREDGREGPRGRSCRRRLFCRFLPNLHRLSGRVWKGLSNTAKPGCSSPTVAVTKTVNPPRVAIGRRLSWTKIMSCAFPTRSQQQGQLHSSAQGLRPTRLFAIGVWVSITS